MFSVLYEDMEVFCSMPPAAKQEQYIFYATPVVC